HAGDLGEERHCPTGARIHLETPHPALLDYELDIQQAAHGKRRGDLAGKLHDLVELRRAQVRRGIDGERVAGVHAGALDVLHDPRHERLLAVTHRVDL